jgi:hypothetical protein
MAETRVSRRHVLIGAGVAGAAGLAALAPNAIVAKADSGEDPLVGAWKGTATLTGVPSFGTLLSFAAGGSLVHSASVDLQNTTAAPNLSSPSYGAWKRTGFGEYAVKFFFFTFDTMTNPSGSGEVRERITVDGDELHGKIDVTIFDATGTVVFTDNGNLTANRVEVDA